jgi:hypothetical protein
MANPFTGLFDEAAKQHGLEPDWLSTFARIESGYNPRVRTGSYKGLFQLSDGEFGKHGGQGDIYDPRSNTFAAAAKLRRERDAFEAKYGRKPTAADIYLIHQQGEGGAAAHWSNPNLPAWQNMYSTAEGRQKGPGWAKQAIWGNVPDDVKAKYGSVDNLTSRDFVDLWTQKVARFGGGAPGPGLLPQPPDGMDASTYGAPSPPPSTKMALGGPKPMPYDENGQWVSENRIRDLYGSASQPIPSYGGRLGPLAALLAGATQGWDRTGAVEAERQNQRFSDAATKRAMGANDLTGVYQALAAGSPEQKKSALSLMLQEKDPVRRLERELKQLEIDQKKSEIAEEAMLFGGAPSPRPAPPAPAMPPPSAPPPAATPPSIPGISVAPPTPSPVVTGTVPTPPAAAPPRPRTNEELRAVLATRAPYEVVQWRKLARKDPKEALKMLDDWVNPNKKQDEARQKELGEAQGKREAEGIPQHPQLVENITKGMKELRGIPDRYGGDKGVFGSAVGPFQGDPNSWFLGTIARALGSLNTIGDKASPAEVRRAIQGSQDTLASVLKPLIRKPGEGTWSDADQARLQMIMGDLMQANDVQQYRREIDNVRRRINANFGLNLPDFGDAGDAPTAAGAPLPRGAKPDPVGLRP